MKTKIKEVHDYFRDKLIKGDFKVRSIEEYYILLIIDGEYLFVIWSANESYALRAESCFINRRFEYSFMDINFREKDKISLWGKIKLIIKKHNDTVVLKAKELEFEKLKKELNK